MIARARAAARTELSRREKARERFIPFVEYNKPDYIASAVHHRLGEGLEAVERGDCQRLIITIAPSTGKSELFSRKFPPYVVGRDPRRSFLSASYGADLAVKLGRDVRNTMASSRYHNLFPHVALSQDSQAADEWHTEQGGGYSAFGVGGGMTGFHGDFLNIDDPFKDRAQAESETYRNAVWDWYRSVFFTRRKDPRTSAIIIGCTRWHEDDLVGRLLAAQADKTGDTWEVIEVPAITGTGESFYPEKFSLDELKHIRSIIGEYDWASLYEQRPRPLTGSFYTEASFLDDNNQPIDTPEMVDFVYAIVDTAVKTGKDHDGCGVEYFSKSDIYKPPLAILDWDLKQIEGAMLDVWLPTVFEELERLAAECKARLGVAGVWIEDKASGMILLQQAEKLMEEHPEWRVYPLDTKLTAMGKTERALNAAPYIHSGQVKITRRAYQRVVSYKGSTKNHLISQLLNFRPSNKDQGQDDLLDTNSYGIAIGLGNEGGF